VGLDTKGSGTLKPIFGGVSFGETSTAANATPDAGLKVNQHGYLASAPLTQSSCTAGQSACPELAVQPSSEGGAGQPGVPKYAAGIVNAAAGAVVTVVFVGDTLTPDAAIGLTVELLECVDNASTTGLFGSCTVLKAQ
jgi:hypothetical protein